ncbi:MFS transporter [Phaeacidiphilus oryzae]|uniref:MFS transporter n=1 Tax=Phaeacidiphilus oryzae TaxID=348818 RepID=UPI00068E39D9|nr:MFS transporter [Phaeacidiphilus oryzae]
MSTETAPTADAGAPPTQAGGAAAAAPHPLTLAAVLLAVFVVPMSISGTAVALPEIGAATHASLAPLQWVVNAFNVAFACFTLVWGSLADILGRIRAFAAGAALFAVASLASALAGNIVLLDVARALAGLGGAAIFSCGAAILSTVYEGPARGKAFALFGTIAGVGVALGPTLGGLLTDSIGWRWVFALHAIALGLVLAVLPGVARSVPHTPRGEATLDLPGSGLFVLATVLLTTAIVEGSQWGWASAGVLSLFAAAVVALVVFTAVEKRREHPMLDLSVLRDRHFLGMCLVPVAASFGFVTMLTYLPSYLTAATGRSSGATGLTMLLLTVPVLVCPMLAAQLVQRGVRPLLLIGLSLVLLVVGDAALTLFSPRVAVAVVAVPMLVTGAGMGLSAGLVDAQALGRIDSAKAGMAAGFLNTLRLGSEAVAVAVYGSLLATLLGGKVEGGLARFPGAGHSAEVAGQAAGGDLAAAVRTSGARAPEAVHSFLVTAYDSAFHTVLWVLAVIGVALAALIAFLLRPERATAEARQSAQSA